LPGTEDMLPIGPDLMLSPRIALHLELPVTVEQSDDETLDFPVSVQFNKGSDRLTVTATRVLDQLGLAMSQGSLVHKRLHIQGLADAAGTAEARRDMARRRAQAVAVYLEQNFSIESRRLAGGNLVIVARGPG
jgi:outer membrane protein OmpA-like peptidoglycan-associated protein